MRVVLLLFLTFCVGSFLFAQGVQQVNLTLSELDQYKWQAADAQANFEALRLDTIIRNFIESNPQVKAFSESAKKAAQIRDAMRDHLFKNAGVSPEDYELKDGAFVKIEKAAGQ